MTFLLTSFGPKLTSFTSKYHDQTRILSYNQGNDMKEISKEEELRSVLTDFIKETREEELNFFKLHIELTFHPGLQPCQRWFCILKSIILTILVHYV